MGFRSEESTAFVGIRAFCGSGVQSCYVPFCFHWFAAVSSYVMPNGDVPLDGVTFSQLD